MRKKRPRLLRYFIERGPRAILCGPCRILFRTVEKLNDHQQKKHGVRIAVGRELKV